MLKTTACPKHKQVIAHAPQFLQPLVSPVIESLVHEHPHLLMQLVCTHGSPLNLIWPQALADNVTTMRAVLERHQVRHEIFYGAKANKSQALVKAAISAGIGVDVSSLYELQDTLSAGAGPLQVCATGPAKTQAFHEALIRCGALISVDSTEEFEHLLATARQLAPQRQARLLLRYRPRQSPGSRFGMDATDLLHCLQRLLTTSAWLLFEGFHFHLSGYGFEDRAQAFKELTPYVETAREMGLNPRTIDIGGGLPMRYVDAQKYQSFIANDNSAAHYCNNTVPSSFYPYGSTLTACQWLDLFLESACTQQQSIADYIKAQDLTLALEPGRSLVDQAALSIFRVTRSKLLGNGKTVLFVEGSSFSACETWFSSEYLVDPIHISQHTESVTQNLSVHAYIAGHSCLDDDVITRRLIYFSKAPQPGDLLIYVNTAGYQMDLLENEFHRHPMPKRMTMTCCTKENFAFSPDY